VALDPFGRATFPLDVWEYRQKYAQCFPEAVELTITATGSDLCVEGKKGKITVTMTMKEGPGYDKMRRGMEGADCDLQQHREWGGFVFDGVELCWDVGESRTQLATHRHSATAVKVLELGNPRLGKQKGTNDLWLWGAQCCGDDESTNIMQIYRLEWSYEGKRVVVAGKERWATKTPFKATITLVGKSDPAGNLKAPAKYSPPKNAKQRWNGSDDNSRPPEN
jgi:hypothetical protein